MKSFFAVLLAAGFAASDTTAQEPVTGFLDRSVTVDGESYAFQVYVPRAYDSSLAWPVILFLHGAGERGSDGLIQTEVGLGPAVRRFAERYPAIVVFPQAPEESLWSGTSAEIALTALDETMQAYSVDADRVYLTGLSMGGHGSWYLGYHSPDRFAAIVPICGWVAGSGFLRPVLPDEPKPHAALAHRLGSTPVWIFHGESDEVVPVTESHAMLEALQDAGGNVRYTELPGTGHNSWDAVYGSPGFANWLLAQRRP